MIRISSTSAELRAQPPTRHPWPPAPPGRWHYSCAAACCGASAVFRHRTTGTRLLRRGVPAREIVAAVRSPEKAADLAANGVQVRETDYDRPATRVILGHIVVQRCRKQCALPAIHSFNKALHQMPAKSPGNLIARIKANRAFSHSLAPSRTALKPLSCRLSAVNRMPDRAYLDCRL